jgi:SAM-dependent methyltransferase
MEIFFNAVLMVLLLSMLFAALSLAPWVPSPSKYLKRALGLAQIKPGERFYELGCGDGRATIYAAKHFGAKATGIELAFPLFVAAKIRALLSRAPDVNIRFGDLFKIDLSDADVIYVYGMPKVLENRLREKLERECKSGTRVISFMFEIKGWEVVAVDRQEGTRGREVPVMLYVL